MSSISVHTARQVKTRAFQQLFINYAKCLRNHKPGIEQEKIKTAVSELVDKAVRRGLVSNNSFLIVNTAIDELYEMSCEELMINETLTKSVLEGILGSADDLSQSLTNDDDIKKIIKYNQAEKDFSVAKTELISEIRSVAECAIEEFFELFGDTLDKNSKY